MKVGGAPHFTPHKVSAAASGAMELKIACEKCSCRFAVIGSAYFCPACGHSSVDRMFDDSLRKIRAKKDNVEVVRQHIAAVGGRDEAELMCRTLIESCLQDGVTAFQRSCDGLYASTGTATPAPMNAFQRLAQDSGLWRARVDLRTSTSLAVRTWSDSGGCSRSGTYWPTAMASWTSDTSTSRATRPSRLGSESRSQCPRSTTSSSSSASLWQGYGMPSTGHR